MRASAFLGTALGHRLDIHEANSFPSACCATLTPGTWSACTPHVAAISCQEQPHSPKLVACAHPAGRKDVSFVTFSAPSARSALSTPCAMGSQPAGLEHVVVDLFLVVLPSSADAQPSTMSVGCHRLAIENPSLYLMVPGS